MPFLLLTLLAAAPLKVAALAPNAVGVDQAVADAMIDRFATQLGAQGDISVVSARDISQVLGMERQKQLLGCNETSSSCTAELAAALGVDVLLTTTFAKIGKSISVTLRALNAKNGEVIAQETHRDADNDALQDWLDGAKTPIANGIRRSFGRTPIATAPAISTNSRSTGPWALAVAGLAVGVGGVTMSALSSNDAAALKSSTTLTLADIDSLERSGVTKRWVAIGLFVAAGACLTTALILFISGAPSFEPISSTSSKVTFNVMPTAGGAYSSLGVTW